MMRARKQSALGGNSKTCWILLESLERSSSELSWLG